jgi:very-long-chain enoyl-CoA reductase
VCRCHVIQRNLRPPGGKGYAIPKGFGFDYITCANYTFEIYGWILFAIATRTLPAALFITAGAGQMALWAKAKHARMRKVRQQSDRASPSFQGGPEALCTSTSLGLT